MVKNLNFNEIIIILTLAENPKRGGIPPKERRFNDKILLLRKESFLEKTLLIKLI